MAFGRKSFGTPLIIPCRILKKNFNVLVQANKNYGICDIILETDTGARTRMESVLSTFQGRPYNSETVMSQVWRAAHAAINPGEA